MTNPQWGKRKTDPPIWEGPRVAEDWEITKFDSEITAKIQIIYDAMDWPQLIFFRYDGFDRVVAPFVLGESSEENPLLRGYQLEGDSRSGKGEGWRVFQIKKMEDLDNYQDFFYTDEFDFDDVYPWIYKVFKML